MVRHVVLLRWMSAISDAERTRIEHDLAALPGEISQILRYDFGPDLILEPGNYDFAIVADFGSEDDYAVYRDHPSHQRVLRETLRPRIESRVAIQFEIGGD
ncbi:MAG: Dabb family protein [Thermoanaerobaculia bacterium]|nr:Dabb family protein [Thermoanaerobaculia bacterium]